VEYKTESIDKITSLVDEMGEERFKQYMKVYLELGKDKYCFFEKFAEYINQCKEDISGNKIMSIMSFKNFLLDMPSMEELKKIWDNIEDPLDEFFGC
jgi:hypothetical protein